MEGSGRSGPIVVTDGKSTFFRPHPLFLSYTSYCQRQYFNTSIEAFSAEHLAKCSNIMTASPTRPCTICREPVHLLTDVCGNNSCFSAPPSYIDQFVHHHRTRYTQPCVPTPIAKQSRIFTASLNISSVNPLILNLRLRRARLSLEVGCVYRAESTRFGEM